MLFGRSRLVLFVSVSALACAPATTPARSVRPLNTEPTSCVSTVGADTTVYDVAQIDEKAVFRSAMKLTYPEALHHRVQGRVVITAIVNADGDVDQASIAVAQHLHPLLDAEARRVVSTATLWPACRNGQAVRSRLAIPFEFAVHNAKVKVWPYVAIGMAAGIAGAMVARSR